MFSVDATKPLLHTCDGKHHPRTMPLCLCQMRQRCVVLQLKQLQLALPLAACGERILNTSWLRLSRIVKCPNKEHGRTCKSHRTSVHGTSIFFMFLVDRQTNFIVLKLLRHAMSLLSTSFNHPISWHSRTQLKHPRNVALQTLLCLFLWPWRRDNSASATVSVDALQKGWYETNEPWLLILMNLQNSHRWASEPLCLPTVSSNGKYPRVFCLCIRIANGTCRLHLVRVCVCGFVTTRIWPGLFCCDLVLQQASSAQGFSFAFAHIFPS